MIAPDADRSATIGSVSLIIILLALPPWGGMGVLQMGRQNDSERLQSENALRMQGPLMQLYRKKDCQAQARRKRAKERTIIANQSRLCSTGGLALGLPSLFGKGGWLVHLRDKPFAAAL
jgi:hypothetical protein